MVTQLKNKIAENFELEDEINGSIREMFDVSFLC